MSKISYIHGRSKKQGGAQDTNLSTTQHGQLKFTTLLMCDIVNSTRLSKKLPPLQLCEFLSEYYSECSEIAAHYTGKVIRCIGDGILCVFEYSDSHEDNASSALLAAKQMNARLKTISFPSHSYVGEVATRIAVVSGVVIPGYINLTGQEVVFGELPFRADQLKKQARKNQIVMDKDTAALARSIPGVQKNLSFSFSEIFRQGNLWLLKDLKNDNRNNIRPNPLMIAQS